jgi:hypothetical protein
MREWMMMAATLTEAEVMDTISVGGQSIDDPEFMAWFGDSVMKEPDGSPKIMYHETNRDNAAAISQSGFDIDKIGARGSDETMPDGIFFKPTNEPIGVARTQPLQMPFALSIQKPLQVRDRDHLAAILGKNQHWQKFATQYDRLEKSIVRAYEMMAKRQDDFHHREGRKASPESTRLQAQINKMFTKGREVAIRVATKARALSTQIIRSAGYDGLVMERDQGGTFGNKYVTTVVIFQPDQARRVRFNW